MFFIFSLNFEICGRGVNENFWDLLYYLIKINIYLYI